MKPIYEKKNDMEEPIIILKIGGSVITNKKNNKIEENNNAISKIAKEIKESIGINKLIIVHGAGSFGHIIAYKNRFTLFDFSSFNEIHLSVMKLNNIFVNIFNKNGIPAIGISPFLISTTKNGRVESMYIKTIVKMLQMGIIPVLYGDVCFDNKKKISILSGDQIVSYLSKKLNVKRVGFGSNIDGILDKHNKQVPIITPNNFYNYYNTIKNSNSIDVTGGMKGKILEIMNILEKKNI